MVPYCWSHGLVVHVQFWSSLPPWAPQGYLVKKIKNSYNMPQRPNYGLILKNTWISCALCQFGPVKMSWGPRRGNSLNSPPPPPSPLFATKKIVLSKLNAFEGSKMMCEEVFFLLVLFRSKHFDTFWHFLSFKVIMYIYSLLWVQQIWLANAYFTFRLNM